jgi:hypothetical protein
MKMDLKSIAALAFLVLVIAATARAENIPAAKTTLIVFADRIVQSRLWPLLAAALQRDAVRGEAPVNGDLEIIPAAKGTPGPAFPSRIEIELLGRCDALWNQNAPSRPGPLGWVTENSGKISPIIYVDCAQIDLAIWPETRIQPRDQRLQTASEAIAHVILHEWTHIATQSAAHASRGLMQSELSTRELATTSLIPLY